MSESTVKISKFEVLDDREIKIYSDSDTGCFEIKFRDKVEKVLVFGDRLIVLVNTNNEEKFNENVFSVSYEAEILWRIERVVHAQEISPYINIVKEQGKLVAHNLDGKSYWVNVENGKIIREWTGFLE